MTSVNKHQLKELKKPDAIQVKLSQILNWILGNVRYVGFAVVPVAIGAGAFYGFRSFQDGSKNKRLEELGKVQIVYENEQRKASEQRQAINAKIEALESPSAVKEPAEGAAPQAAKAKDPKVSEKQATLRQELALVRADHTESVEKYLEFSKKYDSDAEGWLAGMMASQILAETGKGQEARVVLEGLLAKSKDQVFYQTQGRLFLVGLLEDAEDYDRALAELDALDKVLGALGNEDFKPKVLLARGRIQLLKNAKDDAKKTFGTLVEAHAGSPEAQKARAYQTFLN